MKVFTVAFLLSVFGFVSAQGQTLSSAQKKVKTEIFNFLKDRVSNVVNRDYNQISYKYNGTLFLIDISESDENPFFATLSAKYDMPSSHSVQALYNGVKSANLIKGTKVCVWDDFLSFESEMYFKKAESFYSVLLKMSDAIEASAASFLEAYDATSETQGSGLSTSVASSLISSNDFYFPAIRNKGNDSKLYITKVHMDKSYTIVDFISFNNRRGTYCGINKKAYLLAGGRRYQLQKAEGIAYVPNHTEYPNWKSKNDVSLSFKLYFSPLPNRTKEFDFIEPSEKIGEWADGWSLKGVQLDNAGWKYFNSEKLSTSFHYWECIAIQIQSGQTVLRKRVTPKAAGTYVHSSNDEFIEDADTGRKYYLKTSSISFNSSPTLSYDTNPIDFAEVYPALPSSVKRINISSGSQYYIKGLKIR